MPRNRIPKDKDNHSWFRAYLHVNHAVLNQVQQAKELRISVQSLYRLLGGWKRQGLIVMVGGIPHINLSKVNEAFPTFEEMLHLDSHLADGDRRKIALQRQQMSLTRQLEKYRAKEAANEGRTWN